MRNTVNKFMVLCCLVIAFFYLMIPAPASAMENWVWVHSTDKYGFNLDTDYITTHKNENGKVDSADIWMRINYTYEGAKADLKHFDVSSVNASDLQNGHTIYRLHIEFLSGKITPISIVMYDKNNVALYRVEKLESTTVDKQPFFRPIYAYLVSYLAGTPDFTFWKTKNCFPIDKSYNKDGDFTKTDVVVWRAWLDGTNIHTTHYTYTYDSNGNIKKKTLLYFIYNTAIPNAIIKGASIYKYNSGYGWYDYMYADEGKKNRIESIDSGSEADSTIKIFTSLFEKYPAFAHRFDGGGLTLKPELNK